jgi:hypothetical protein
MINRSNYEEFFLLYADNELSSTDKKMVEAFLLQNPDLKEEFAMLQRSLLTPDPKIVFENKDILLKQIFTNSMINDSNYEEYFLLYTDNELDKAARNDVEAFASQKPGMLESLQIILQTKLIPDTGIKFEGKEILYKKEEDRRIILLPWLRMAAAAMVLFLAGYFFYHFRNNSLGTIVKSDPAKAEMVRPLTGNEPGKNKKEAIAVTSQSLTPLDQTGKMKKNQGGNQIMQNNKSVASDLQNQNKKVSANQINTDVDGSTVQIKPAIINKVFNRKEIVEVGNPKNESLGDKPLVNTTPNALVANSNAQAVAAADQHEGINYVEQAIQKENTPTAEEDFYVANISPKKSKLRGLFRKVSRVFDKTTNADSDNRHGVSIGVFRSL